MAGNAVLEPPVTILGLRTGAGPLLGVRVALGAGLTALYGRNGAGKTFFLTGLREALTGRAEWGGQLLCDFPPGSHAYSWVQQLLTYPYTHGVWAPGRHGESPYTPEDRRADQERLVDAAVTWFQYGGRNFVPDDYSVVGEHTRLLAAEIGTASTFALVPTGSFTPQWDVWLCMPADRTQFPLCEAAVADYRRLRDELLADEKRSSARITEIETAADVSDDDYRAAEAEEEKFLDEWRLRGRDLLGNPVCGWEWNLPLDRDPPELSRRMDGLLADGLPVPVVRLGTARSVPLYLVDDRDESDLDQATAAAFADSTAHEKWSDVDDLRLRGMLSAMRTWARELEGDVNDVYGALLLDAPNLTVTVESPTAWLTRPAFHWSSKSGSKDLPVTTLSSAERRWAQFAIRWMLRPANATSVIVIDEPEAALHRTAESHMAAGLTRLAERGTQVVVATHAPEVLDAPSTTQYEVRKIDGWSEVFRLRKIDLDSLEGLGMRPSDLLGRHHVFLLVEGIHDQIVIGTLCKEEIETYRVHIIPLHGARNLPDTLDSRVLFDHTTAHLLAVLDNVEAEKVTEVWARAQQIHLVSGGTAAIDYMKQQLPGKKNEHVFLRDWLNRALELGVNARTTPWGLSAADIVEYLPVDVLVPKPRRSWAELRQLHEALPERSPKGKPRPDFKTWLVNTYAGTSFDPERIVTALRAMSPADVHEDFHKLGYRIRDLGIR